VLTGDRRWVEAGHDEESLVWGRCQGSATTPYQSIVDLRGPAYHCSCPSRSVPCKHVLALLLRWAAGQVGAGDPPDWVHDWALREAARAARREAYATRPRQANPKTAARRADRMAAGLVELDRWLADRVAVGAAGLTTVGYEPFDLLARRLGDAQATGAAGLVRRLGGVAVSGSPERLVTELGLLRLLVAGYGRLDSLPEPMAATVSNRVGRRITTEEVLATPPVSDAWAVLGIRDEVDEQLTTRRVWLRGCTTGRMALAISYARPGESLSGDFVLGTTVAADLCYYPGAAPRALVAGRSGIVPDAVPPPADPVAAALDSWAAALAADPWLDRWPVLLDAVIPTTTHVVEPGGDALPLVGEHWALIAAAGGRPCRVMGEYGSAGLRPLTAWVDGRVIGL
jgi:hypothetical protein